MQITPQNYDGILMANQRLDAPQMRMGITT